MTTCQYTGGQVSRSLTPNLSRRTAQFLADSSVQLPRASTARGTTDMDQRTDVHGLLVERGDRNELIVSQDEAWFSKIGQHLILGNLRIDPRFATLSCWKTGRASAEDAIIVRHRMWRLAEQPALENHIFTGIDVADLRSALLINQRWEHISADWLTDNRRPPLEAPAVAAARGAAPNSSNGSRRNPATPTPNSGSPPRVTPSGNLGTRRHRSANRDWNLIAAIVIVIALIVFGIVYRTHISLFILGR
jgi:hypothetical protein